MPSPFDADKRTLIEEVLDRHQVRFSRLRPGWQKVRCPSEAHPRGDRNPSASVNLSIGQFRCFGCDLGGDGFDLMLELEDLRAVDVRATLDVASERKEPEWLF